MKTKYIKILLFLICSQVGFAQNKLFDKYADMDHVTSVYISKAMFQMIPQMADIPMNLTDMAGKAESLQIVSTGKKDLIPQMRNDFAQLVDKGHEELMRVKDGNTRVKFYADTKGGLIKELLMVANEDSSFTVIQLLGNFTLKDIQEISNNTVK